jgi:protein-L-isoaspartate(D-aspartate) O-methyltransferase
MLHTPRHEFVLPKYRRMAYFDMALPIGGEQTISSPFIVSFMTESIDPQPTDRVLEIGTGSGYQAAVLSPLVDQVFTIEIVESLGRKAARLLKRLKYKNVHVKVGDGFKGWHEHAPFDKIIVTCSPENVPQPLVDQLRDGGRMVIPVGERYQQTLYLFTKKEGKLVKEALRPTLFVPMTGTAETQRDVQPDPANPVAINGDFEDKPDQDGTVPGWYYGRQMRIESDATSPQGQSHVVFENADDGRGSRLLQGVAMDGRKVKRLKMSTWFKCRGVRPSSSDTLPAMVIVFYDEHRREIGQNWLGPWRGTAPWGHYQKTIRVPVSAREAILRIGLHGAIGIAAFDDVRIGRL